MTYEEIINKNLEPNTIITITVSKRYTYELPYKLVKDWYKHFQYEVKFEIKNNYNLC